MAKRAKAPKKKAAKRPHKPGQSEKTLHMLCQQWLVKSGWWGKLLIFHVPNERRGGIGAIMHFRRLGVRPGVADYLIFNSRDAAIELKDKDGVQSEDQEKFQRQWESAGKLYFVVRTLEAFQGTVTALSMF
jgi:hypothetical protein